MDKRINTKLLECVSTQSQVPLSLIFLIYYTFTVLPALSALRQAHACSNSNASTVKPMAFALSHTLAPTTGTISPQSSLKSKLKTFLFSDDFRS